MSQETVLALCRPYQQTSIFIAQMLLQYSEIPCRLDFPQYQETIKIGSNNKNNIKISVVQMNFFDEAAKAKSLINKSVL